MARFNGPSIHAGREELATGSGISDERTESVIEGNTQAIEEIDEGHNGAIRRTKKRN